jgi:AAA family ATP:ADP antiporter
VNILGVVLQLFVVSRLLKYLGVRVAVMILPMIAMGGYLFAAFYPMLAIIRVAKIAENATDYSIQNTVRQVLFLPTTREQKYKAKQAIDTFFVRSGDVLSAGLIFVGSTWWSLSTQQFALINSGLVLVWLLIAFWVGRGFKQQTTESSG